VAAASLGALGPRNPGSSGASPGAFVPVTTIVYQVVPPMGAELTAADLDATVQILKARASSTHAAGLVVTPGSPNRVSVSVSGAVDMEALRLLLGHTGKLAFVYLPPDLYGTAGKPGIKAVPSTGDPIDPTLPAQFTGADIDPASYGVSPDPSTPDRSAIDFAFKPAIATQFAVWTGQHVNDYLAVVLDGVVQSAMPIVPYVDGGRGEVTANYTASSAATLVALLRYGALPFPVQEVSVAVSTPGSESARPSTSSSGPSGSVAPSSPAATPTPLLPTPILPTPATGATGTFIAYVVKPGDTLSAIANWFNVSLSSLEAANPQLGAGWIIVIGSTVNIPPP
jgi:LysM repeat protein